MLSRKPEAVMPPIEDLCDAHRQFGFNWGSVAVSRGAEQLYGLELPAGGLTDRGQQIDGLPPIRLAILRPDEFARAGEVIPNEVDLAIPASYYWVGEQGIELALSMGPGLQEGQSGGSMADLHEDLGYLDSFAHNIYDPRNPRDVRSFIERVVAKAVSVQYTKEFADEVLRGVDRVGVIVGGVLAVYATCIASLNSLGRRIDMNLVNVAANGGASVLGVALLGWLIRDELKSILESHANDAADAYFRATQAGKVVGRSVMKLFGHLDE